MKSLAKLYDKPGIWLNDAPMPTFGPNDLLIKIRKTVICGTECYNF